MGRGVSSRGGQSSLGYPFGSGEAPKPTASNGTSTSATSEVPRTENEVAKINVVYIIINHKINVVNFATYAETHR